MPRKITFKFPKKITVAWLKRKGACPAAYIQFGELFPKGADITIRNLNKAWSDLDLRDWIHDFLHYVASPNDVCGQGRDWRKALATAVREESRKRRSEAAPTRAVRAAAKRSR